LNKWRRLEGLIKLLCMKLNSEIFNKFLDEIT